MDQRLDQLTTIQFAIPVHIMHTEIVKCQLLFRHGGEIHWNVHVLLQVSKCEMRIVFVILLVNELQEHDPVRVLQTGYDEHTKSEFKMQSLKNLSSERNLIFPKNQFVFPLGPNLLLLFVDIPV